MFTLIRRGSVCHSLCSVCHSLCHYVDYQLVPNRAIKLLEQPMKVLERVLEKRIRCQVSIDNMQFGLMPGKGTTDAIFIMRQVQEKHQAKKKKLYYAFVDLEKAFDRVPREVVRWALRKLGVDEWLIRTDRGLHYS